MWINYSIPKRNDIELRFRNSLINLPMESPHKIKKLAIVINAKGILNVLLGIVHIVVAFAFEYNRIKTNMPEELSTEYFGYFLALGVFLLFIGCTDILCSKGLKQKLPFAWNIAFCCSVFTTFLGSVGLLIFHWKPSPPYLIFLTGIIGIVFLATNRKEFQKVSTDK